MSGSKVQLADKCKHCLDCKRLNICSAVNDNGMSNIECGVIKYRTIVSRMVSEQMGTLQTDWVYPCSREYNKVRRSQTDCMMRLRVLEKQEKKTANCMQKTSRREQTLTNEQSHACLTRN
mmetsp:Transcript_14297/g.22339  ORF Transcript_14297/g.22339 Transcript_14297/m.22339 type:complete len:120 (+) Transcript_14297:441-800(+)